MNSNKKSKWSAYSTETTEALILGDGLVKTATAVRNILDPNSLNEGPILFSILLVET